MRDTGPDMEARQRALLLACSVEQRLAISSALFETTRRIVTSSIRAANPAITEPELRQQIFLRFYGQDFTPEQRDRILQAIAAHWERSEAKLPGGPGGA